LVGFEAREPMGFCTTLNGTKTAGFFGWLILVDLCFQPQWMLRLKIHKTFRKHRDKNKGRDVIKADPLIWIGPKLALVHYFIFASVDSKNQREFSLPRLTWETCPSLGTQPLLIIELLAPECMALVLQW
jgi:hypothetical protein